MSSTYIIEIGEFAVGLVTRDAAGAFRFFASDSRLHALEGQSFPRLRQVERRARDLIAGRSSAIGRTEGAR
jgi:hypothetical protein